MIRVLLLVLAFLGPLEQALSHQGIDDDNRDKSVEFTTCIPGKSPNQNTDYAGQQNHGSTHPHTHAGPH